MRHHQRARRDIRRRLSRREGRSFRALDDRGEDPDDGAGLDRGESDAHRQGIDRRKDGALQARDGAGAPGDDRTPHIRREKRDGHSFGNHRAGDRGTLASRAKRRPDRARIASGSGRFDRQGFSRGEGGDRRADSPPDDGLPHGSLHPEGNGRVPQARFE